MLEDVKSRIFADAGEVGMIGAPGEGTLLPGKTDGKISEFFYGAGAGDETFKYSFGGAVLTGEESLFEVIAEDLGVFGELADVFGKTGSLAAPQTAVEVDEGGSGI